MIVLILSMLLLIGTLWSVYCAFGHVRRAEKLRVMARDEHIAELLRTIKANKIRADQIVAEMEARLSRSGGK